MLNSNKRIIRHKLDLLNLAEELGNVVQLCKVMGLSPKASSVPFVYAMIDPEPL